MQPVKELFARRGLTFGSCSTGGQNYTNRMSFRECNLRQDGNYLNLGQTQAVEGVWNFTNAKAVSTPAVAAGQQLHHGGHIIYHLGEPAWLSGYTTASGLRGKLQQHFEQIITAFPEYLSWNVCNEVIATWEGQPGGWRNTRYFQVLGAGWPAEWFTYARQFTDKELVWNDNHAIEDVDPAAFNANKTAIIAALNAGAPIDTYGMQMHSCAPTGAVMVDRLNQMAELGLDIRITEFDVTDTGALWPNLATRRAEQIAYTEARLGPIIQQVPRLKSFSMWCNNDSDSWLNAFLGPRNDGALREFLPYDRRGFIKPEWWAMFERVTRP
jgi:endo-1,4-beta-xylanase